MILNSCLSVLLFSSIETAADRYLYAGNYAAAAVLYEQALRQQPSSSICSRLARVYYHLGRYEQSQYYLRLVTAPTASDLFYLGLARLSSGQFDSAAASFNMARAAGYPERSALAYYQAVVLVFSNDWTRARAGLEALPPIKDKDWWLGYVLARTGHEAEGQNRLARAVRHAGWWQADAAYLLAILQDSTDPVLRSIGDDRMALFAARQELRQGDLVTARRLYLQSTPGNPYRILGEAFVLEHQDSLVQALQRYASIIDASDDVVLKRLACRRSAAIEIERHNTIRAKQHLLRYIALPGDLDEAIFFELGSIYFDAGIYDSALLFFNPLNDTTDRYLFALGRTHYRMNDDRSARQVLEEHRRRFPASPWADRTLVILGNISSRQHAYAAARDYWQQLIDDHPLSQYRAFAQMQIANTYAEDRDYSRALAAYRRIEKMNPAPALLDDARLKIEEIGFNLGHHSTIADALQAFVAKYPNSPSIGAVELRLAEALIEEGSTQRAIGLLERFQTKDPARADLFLLMTARAYRREGDWAKQKECYHRLLASYPHSPHRNAALGELAFIYSEEGLFDSALRYYGDLLPVKEYRPKALLEMVRVYRALKKHDEAQLVLERLINEGPPDDLERPVVQERLLILKDQGRFEEALRIIESFEEKKIEDGRLMQTKGDILTGTANYAGARGSYLKAAELFSQERDHAAYALFRAGEMSLALYDSLVAQDYFRQASALTTDQRLRVEIEKKLRRPTRPGP